MRRAMWIGVAVFAAALSAGLRADCVSINRAVTQPTVFPNHPAGPIAWDGSALGVAKNDTDFTHAIWFALYDTDLNPLTSDVRVVDTTGTGVLALTWNGSEFAVFYQTADLQLRFQRISASGQPFGGPIAVAANHLNWQNQEYDVAWDATRQTYDVIHTITSGRDRGLWLTLVASDGTVVDDSNLTYFFSNSATPRIAVSNGSVGIVFVYSITGNEQLFFILFDLHDNVAMAEPISQNGRSPVLAASPTSFFVITQAPAAGGTTELRSTRLDINGNIVSPDATFLSPRGVDIAPQSLIWNPTLGEWAFLYADSVVGFNLFPGETRLRRFHTPATVPPSDTPFTPDTTHSTFAEKSPIVWNGASYFGSIGHVVTQSEGSDTWLVRHCPLIVAGSAPALIPVMTNVTFRALPSGGTPDYLYTWDFGDLNSATGAIVQHQYAHPGSYTVTLTITDTAHATATTSLTVRVVIPRERAARH